MNSKNSNTKFVSIYYIYRTYAMKFKNRPHFQNVDLRDFKNELTKIYEYNYFNNENDSFDFTNYFKTRASIENLHKIIDCPDLPELIYVVRDFILKMACTKNLCQNCLQY